MNEPDLEARLVELEVRYTHQQELLEQLSDVLAAQQRDIAVLAQEVRRLRDLGSAGPKGELPADEKPPHY